MGKNKITNEEFYAIEDAADRIESQFHATKPTMYTLTDVIVKQLQQVVVEKNPEFIKVTLYTIIAACILMLRILTPAANVKPKPVVLTAEEAN